MTTTARQLRSVHRQSANFAQEAWLAKENGQQERSVELYRKAYGLEKEVASAYLDLKDMEPTRSIILKSAAVLANESIMNVIISAISFFVYFDFSLSLFNIASRRSSWDIDFDT